LADAIQPMAKTWTDPAGWDSLAASLPGAHLLQSWQWGEFKARTGWRPRRLSWETPGGPVAAQVLARTAARVATVLYVPKGPLLAWDQPAARTRALDALEALGIDNPIVCCNINKIGFRMCGGIELYEKTIATRRFRPIAMSVLASGAIAPREAIEYVCRHRQIESIVFGASSRANISHTKALIDELSRPPAGGAKDAPREKPRRPALAAAAG